MTEAEIAKDSVATRHWTLSPQALPLGYLLVARASILLLCLIATSVKVIAAEGSSSAR